LRFLHCCYDTILVLTAESWFLCTAYLFYRSGNSFSAPFVCLLLWGFLCTILVWFISYGLENSCFRCCWKVLCATHMLFIPLLLEESLFQCYWNALYTVHIRFIPYCLESAWSNAVGLPCAQFAHCSSPIVFGEFLFLLYFRETLFLVHAILLPLFTWAFCSFSFRVSSVC